MRFAKRNQKKSPAKTEAPKAAGTRGSTRKKAEVNEEPPEDKVQDKKVVNAKGPKNNRQPVKKGKATESNQKGNKKGKKVDVAPKDDKKTVENKKTENTPKEEVKTKDVENSSNEDHNNEAAEIPKETAKTRGRGNPKAKATPAKSKAQSTAGKKTPQVPKVKKATPVKTNPAPPPPAADVEKKSVVPTRTSARGRKPKVIVDPSEDATNGDSDRPRKTAQKRKSTSKAPAEDANSKPKAAKRSASRKSTAKSDKPTLNTSLQPQHQVSIAASTTSGEKNVQVTHIIEEQVVSPQVLEAGAAASNGIPVLQAADLLLSESNPHRFTKMIMQPSQELPAEIFQNEQTVTVTSPQKSPKILKLVLGPQGAAGTSLLHGLNPVRGPAVIVKQNTAAGDIGNPDQITCLNVFNGSPRRSVTGNDSNGESGTSTSDVRGPGDSEDTAVRFYNPSSPGKLVGEGLHNYCKSPLLAPAGTFPPSPTTTKIITQPQPSSKQSSTHSEAPEKKSRKRTVSSGVVEAPAKNPRKVVASPPAPVGPSPTRRSARGNAGKPPKRESMIEIPIVNRRRSSSTNLS